MVSSVAPRLISPSALIALPQKMRSSFRKIRRHQHDAFGPRIGREAGTLIGRERFLVIERAGVHQETLDRFGPAEFDGLMQQPWPDASSGEFRSQSEIADLSDSGFAEIEFRYSP